MPLPAEVPFAGLRRIGPFFTLTSDPLPGGRALAELLAGGEAVDAVIARYADRLGTSRRDIAGSLFLQGWASRLASVHLGCLALAGGVPDLGPDNLTYHFPDAGPVEFALHDPGLSRAEPGWAPLVEHHLAPLIAVVDEDSGPGSRRLWGNVASAWAGAVVMLRRKGLSVTTGIPVELADYGDWADGRYLRRTCCNLFRVQGYGLCGDCVIPH